MLLDLPLEINIYILTFLEPYDLVRLSSVNRFFRRECLSDFIWIPLVIKEFTEVNISRDWYEYYKTLVKPRHIPVSYEKFRETKVHGLSSRVKIRLKDSISDILKKAILPYENILKHNFIIKLVCVNEENKERETKILCCIKLKDDPEFDKPLYQWRLSKESSFNYCSNEKTLITTPMGDNPLEAQLWSKGKDEYRFRVLSDYIDEFADRCYRN